MRENKKKESFFEKRGFFITLVVIVSVMVIAVIMNMIVPKETEEDTFDAEVWNEAVEKSSKNYDDGLNSVYNEPAKAVSSARQPENSAETPADSENTDIKSQTSESAPAWEEETGEKNEPDANNSLMLFEKPVDGSIVKDYSADELVYSDTMQDWRVHQGIDFAAEEGADVRAVADGVIEAVTENGMLGTCVVISHADGVKTMYCNLQEGSASMVGMQVKTGDVIAKAGNTAALEVAESPHIHFEVIFNEKNVNPHDYFKDTVTDDE